MNSSPISTVITSEAMLQSDKRTRRFALFKSLQTSIIQVSESSCLLVFCLLVCCQSNSQTCKNNQDPVGAAMLHLWCGYAALLVYLCWTVGIPMLNLWYQNALLFWYRFFNLFTGNIKARIRMKNEE